MGEAVAHIWTNFRPLGVRQQERLPSAVRLDALHHGAEPGAGAAGLEGPQGASPAAVAERGADTGGEATKTE